MKLLNTKIKIYRWLGIPVSNLLLKKLQKICEHHNIKGIRLEKNRGKFQCCGCHKIFNKMPYPDYINVPHKNFL